jgi:hypothetical protein
LDVGVEEFTDFAGPAPAESTFHVEDVLDVKPEADAVEGIGG